MYLSIHLSIYLYIYLYIYQYIYLFICIFIYPSLVHPTSSHLSKYSHYIYCCTVHVAIIAVLFHPCFSIRNTHINPYPANVENRVSS